MGDSSTDRTTRLGAPDGSGTRDRLLDAAERVVVAHGAVGLTLEAVAADAGVSKGGLLYHFPSKDSLAAGLVERAVQRVDQALSRAAADQAPGSFTRAYIRVSLGPPRGRPAAGDPLSTALLAAFALDPSLLDPLREAYAGWQQRLEDDGLRPADATLARLAVDGWWTSLVLGLPPLSPQVRRGVRDLLERLAAPRP
jgi:AcrR family transcriptional regulator